MRPVKLLLALACCLPTLHAASETAVETRKTQNVPYDNLVATPLSWQYTTVRFRATWIGITGLYDRLGSHFRSERYTNVSVWSDRAPLWEPAARAVPLTSLYMSKDAPGADRLAAIPKFATVEIEAVVFDAIDGLPRLEIKAIREVPKTGAFSDAVLARVQQAVAMNAQNAYDLAEQDYATAMATNLPASGRIGIGELRARNLIAASRWNDAAAVLNEIIPLADADAQQSPAVRSGLYSALARSLSEQAGTDAGLNNQAVAAAQRAVDLDPSQSEAYAVLGVSLAGLGRFDEAQLQCDRAVRLRPNDAAVRLTRGRILDQQGRFDEAVDALKQAIDLTPRDPRTHRAIATAYLHRSVKGAPADLAVGLGTALRECDIALRLAPQDAEAMWLSGQIMAAAQTGKAELALPGGKVVPTREQVKERYQAALTADPNNANAKASLQGIVDAEAKEKADAEAKAKAEADAKAKAEAEAKAKAEAEAKAKADAEAKAKAEAAAKAKAEAEAKAKAEAEAKAKADAEAKAKAEAAAKAKAEADKAKADTDAKAKAEADKAKADADAKAKADAAKADADAKAKAKADADAKAKADADKAKTDAAKPATAPAPK